MTVQTAFRLDSELLERLKSLSAEEGRTQTWYVNKALNEYFAGRKSTHGYTEKTKIKTSLPVKAKPPAQQKVKFTALGFSADEESEIYRIRKKNKGGEITQRVANALIKEFKEAIVMGYTFDEQLNEWEARGWKSFKAAWLDKKPAIINRGQETRSKDLKIGDQLTDTSWAN